MPKRRSPEFIAMRNGRAMRKGRLRAALSILLYHAEDYSPAGNCGASPSDG